MKYPKILYYENNKPVIEMLESWQIFIEEIADGLLDMRNDKYIPTRLYNLMSYIGWTLYDLSNAFK